ncbi:MAG: SDR family oxidoreductase [Rhabdochlamydiaceae bacterium]
MKTILITGSKGFVGSALADYLQNDYSVYGYDLQDGLDILGAASLSGVDIVIHCAALTSVEGSKNNPHEYYKTNVLGTSKIVELCLKSNTQLIYFSSAAIFDPTSSPYADSKSIAHELVEVFRDKLRGVIFVPFNIYSIKPKRGSLFHHFLYDKELSIHGNGKQTRDFINIIDICSIVKTALDEEWEKETMELGIGKQISINEIADFFADFTGKKKVYKKQSCGIKNSLADINHLRDHYDKKFKTNLKKDIEQMIINLN